MQFESLICSCCRSDYDQITRIPKIIPICGHTICAICLTQLSGWPTSIQCPLDRKKFIIGQNLDFQSNFAVIQLLEEKDKIVDDLLKNLDDDCKKIEISKELTQFTLEDTKKFLVKTIKDYYTTIRCSLEKQEAELLGQITSQIDSKIDAVNQKYSNQNIQTSIKDRVAALKSGVVRTATPKNKIGNDGNRKEHGFRI